jgi:hypothetical protein
LLEALYLWLQWGLEFNQAESVWKSIHKLSSVSFIQDGPSEACLLPSDTTCYHYLFMVTYLTYCDLLGDYQRGMSAIPHLLTRAKLPLRIKQLALTYQNKFQQNLEYLRQYNEIVHLTGVTLQPRVELQVRKSTRVSLHADPNFLTKLRQHTLKTANHQELKYPGLVFQCDKPKSLPGLHVLLPKTDSVYVMSCYYVSAIGELEEYLVKECPVVSKTTVTTKLTDRLRRRNREFSQRKPVGLLPVGLTDEPVLIRKITDHVTISLPKHLVGLDRVSDYQCVVLLSEGEYQRDLAILFQCFQAGCHVMYAGNIQLYRDCRPHFSEYLSDLTGKNESEIADHINRVGEIIKAREPPEQADMFSLPNLMDRWVHPPKTVSQFATVYVKDSQVFQYQADQYNFVQANNLVEGLQLLQTDMQDQAKTYGILHLEGVLSHDNLRIATYLIGHNLLTNIDVLRLPTVNRDYCSWNTKIVLGSRDWEWTPLKPLTWKGTLVFQGVNSVSRCLSAVTGRTVHANLEHLVRAVAL